MASDQFVAYMFAKNVTFSPVQEVAQKNGPPNVQKCMFRILVSQLSEILKDGQQIVNKYMQENLLGEVF